MSSQDTLIAGKISYNDGIKRKHQGGKDTILAKNAVQENVLNSWTNLTCVCEVIECRGDCCC